MAHPNKPVSYRVTGEDGMYVQFDVYADTSVVVAVHDGDSDRSEPFTIAQIRHLAAAIDCLPPRRFDKFHDALHLVAPR